MKILIIPDVHLKPWMFERADEALKNIRPTKQYALWIYPTIGEKNAIWNFTRRRSIRQYGFK